MAGNFKKNWKSPLLLLALGTPIMMFGIMKTIALSNAAITGEIPNIPDAAHQFARPIPILLHIIPSILFVLTGPIQFAHRVRIRWPRLHRISGRIYVLSGLFVVGAGLWMNQFYPHYGGPLKYWGVLIAGLGFLVSITLAVCAILRRDILRHRIWMTRAIALGLGPGTQSIFAIPVFLTMGLNDSGIGAVVALGFTINLVFAEWHIRRHLRSTP